VISRSAFRDDLAALGSATCVRVREGPIITSLSMLVVNGAAETLDYRVTAAPSSPHTIRALIQHELKSTFATPGAVVLAREDDLALESLPASSIHVAGVRLGLSDTGAQSPQVAWRGKRPGDGTPAREIVRRLASRGLLLEPFQRLDRLGEVQADHIDTRMLAPPLSSYLRQHGPVDWPHEFLPYQCDGIKALVDRDTLLLADDMGLGKTVQAAAAIRILLRTGAIKNALVVAPASILRQWYRAVKLWAPDLRISSIRGNDRAWQWRADAHVFLVSFETLRADFTENPASGPRRRSWGLVVLDEAQKIKNRDVDVSRICKRLSRARSWALTGTPLENRIDDVRSICEFLLPDHEAAKRLEDIHELRRAHAKLQLRRRKQDVLTQLPPKTSIEVPISLGTAQRSSYDKAERDGMIWLRELGQTVSITHVLELITRLKQVCNFCPETGQSAKADDIADRLGVLFDEGHRALLFTQYTDAQFGAAALAQRLSRYRPELYTGSMSADEKEDVLRRFKAAESPRPLILSLRAGGYGLNLQEASYVFHFDRWWNPAVEHQAEDRTHRYGQTQPVTVYAYVCTDTIEERIQEILQTKGELFKEWIDNVSIETSASLTEKEIFGLFGMSPPVRRDAVPTS